MKPNLIKIFKFIEDKIGKKLNSGQSFRLKLIYDPSSLTKEDLDVEGNLILSNTQIQSLPNGLTVKGDLYLSNTLIKSLPNGLTVRGDLSLSGSKIESLPNDLTVGGYLYLSDTPISKKYTEEQIRKMVPNVKGRIYI